MKLLNQYFIIIQASLLLVHFLDFDFWSRSVNKSSDIYPDKRQLKIQTFINKNKWEAIYENKKYLFFPVTKL